MYIDQYYFCYICFDWIPTLHLQAGIPIQNSEGILFTAGSTALHIAAKRGDGACVSSLILKGIHKHIKVVAIPSTASDVVC